MTDRVEIGDCTLYCGDCRDVLPDVSGVDVVFADPPYSSGGAMRSDRNLPAAVKYSRIAPEDKAPDFSGDNRDQRSFMFWSADWMAKCLQVTRNKGALLCFIDWRNLPCLVDALQVGGWVYRGIVPWDKTETARPNKGWFRAQCEYIVTATAGPLDAGARSEGRAQPGLFRRRAVQGKRQHIAEKPIDLLADVLETRGDWGTVLDPFMGSGATGAACVRLGRRFIGIEMERVHFETACRRIEAAYKEREALLHSSE